VTVSPWGVQLRTGGGFGLVRPTRLCFPPSIVSRIATLDEQEFTARNERSREMIILGDAMRSRHAYRRPHRTIPAAHPAQPFRPSGPASPHRPRPLTTALPPSTENPPHSGPSPALHPASALFCSTSALLSPAPALPCLGPVCPRRFSAWPHRPSRQEKPPHHISAAPAIIPTETTTPGGRPWPRPQSRSQAAVLTVPPGRQSTQPCLPVRGLHRHTLGGLVLTSARPSTARSRPHLGHSARSAPATTPGGRS